MTEESPAEIVQRHRAEFVALADEAQFVAAVRELPLLADSDDPYWDDYHAWNDVYRLIAAADAVGERGCRPAVSLLYERAAVGDMNEVMQGIRHGPEKAYADDYEAFVDVLEPLASHPRAGTREWAVAELGIVRLLRSLPIIVGAAHDPVHEVRAAATLALRRLAQVHPEAAQALAGLD